MVKSKEEEKEYQKAWREKNREHINKKSRENYQKNKEKRRKTSNEYYQRNKKRLRPIYSKRNKELNKKLREIIIKHYTKNKLKCQNCGFNGGIDFLVIDHVNGGGTKERKDGGNMKMLKKIINKNFPKEYNIICANCNHFKRMIGRLP